MHDVLELLAAAVATPVVVVALSLGTMLRRLRRANRVVPDRRSPAPLSWRWSPRRPAVLHRRLRRSCELVVAVTAEAPARRRRAVLRRRARAPRSALQAAGDELLERAVAVDRALCELDHRSTAWRRRHLPALAAEVDAIDTAAHRLCRLEEELRRPGGGLPASSAESVLDAFESALGELRPLEPELPAPG